MTNVEIVRRVYERFAAGDAAGVLEMFDQSIEFRLAEGHPYQPDGNAWVGGEEITRHFFARAGAEWDGWTIAFDEPLAMTDAVVVECRYHALYRPTGRKLDAQACHVWRFRNGKIVSFHQYIDTGRLQDVMERTAQG